MGRAAAAGRTRRALEGTAYREGEGGHHTLHFFALALRAGNLL